MRGSLSQPARYFKIGYCIQRRTATMIAVATTTTTVYCVGKLVKPPRLSSRSKSGKTQSGKEAKTEKESSKWLGD